MTDAAPRSSADLRQELGAIDVDLQRLDGELTSADVRLRGSALLARRGDPAAVKQVVEARASKTDIAVEMDLMAAARAALTVELAAALEREAQAARETHAAEARAFADAIGPIGAMLDKSLSDFKIAYLDLKRRLNVAKMAEYGPGGDVVGASLKNALRAILWDVTELDVKPPGEGPRRSFSSLTASWSAAAEGAAKRLLAPPPALAPKPNNGVNGAAHPASSKPAAERSIPRQVDLAEALPGDDPTFKVHADRDAANAAIRAAAVGPQGRK
jgi:hypothetical protein